MIATVTHVSPVQHRDRGEAQSLFKRLDSDGNGRLTVADGVSTVVNLSLPAVARFAEAANQAGQVTAKAQQADDARQAARRADALPMHGLQATAARYQAMQTLAA